MELGVDYSEIMIQANKRDPYTKDLLSQIDRLTRQVTILLRENAMLQKSIHDLKLQEGLIEIPEEQYEVLNEEEKKSFAVHVNKDLINKYKRVGMLAEVVPIDYL